MSEPNRAELVMLLQRIIDGKPKAWLELTDQRLREIRDLLDRPDPAPVAVPDTARLIDALAFYADPATYVGIGFLRDDPCGEFVDDFEDTALGCKPGARARDALIQIPEAAEEKPIAAPPHDLAGLAAIVQRVADGKPQAWLDLSEHRLREIADALEWAAGRVAELERGMQAIIDATMHTADDQAANALSIAVAMLAPGEAGEK